MPSGERWSKPFSVHLTLARRQILFIFVLKHVLMALVTGGTISDRWIFGSNPIFFSFWAAYSAVLDSCFEQQLRPDALSRSSLHAESHALS
jgi:hypothetical protein